MTKAKGSSFYWGMRLLPEPKRGAMFALYDLARAIDDAADNDAPLAAKRRAIADWRAEIAALYQGKPTRAETIAILPYVKRNILRDVDEDRARGRDYVPPGTDLAVTAHAKLAEAERLRQGLDARALRPALVMTELYRALLAALLRGERRLSRFAKLRAVAIGVWKSR